MAKLVKLIDKPKLFSPQVARSSISRAGTVQLQDLGRDRYTNAGSTSSFRYDNPGTGIKSTQEIPVDFSRFENHTFFSSAVIKTNVAFDKIINDFPFDGTEKDLEVFEDGLTGWEKYVLGRFPTYTGYLFFSGNQNTHVVVQNSSGYLFPGTSKDSEGSGVLDTNDSSFSIESFLFIPAESNSRQVICQRQSSDGVGFNIGLESDASTSKCGLIFHVKDSVNVMSASVDVPKGSFFQFCAAYDARPGQGDLKIFYNAKQVVSSSNSVDSLELIAGTAPLTIGSGSTFLGWVPQQTLSGAMEDFRFFSDYRTPESQTLGMKQSVFQDGNMNLYFKFNEPTGSYGLEDVLLDSSGNSLHSRIQNYSDYDRTQPVGQGPLTNENESLTPILYPNFTAVSNLNADLLLSASLYDAENPNLITKLVPPHYFLDGQNFQGLGSLEGSINDAYTSLSIPGTGILGQTQIMMSLLFVWSKHFDEMKIFIDSISNSLSVDYDTENTIPDKILPFLADYYGFTLPNIFSFANTDQYVKGINVNAEDIRAVAPLKEVQNQIWRRILTNLQEITKTKGTKQSIRSIMLAAGIDPDSVFKIREYGGPSKTSLSGLRQNRTEVSAMLDMSGTLRSTSSTNSQGFGNNNPYLISTYLSASRTSLGAPYSNGSFNSGYSNSNNDGILTKHSFTYEGIYSWRDQDYKFTTQSLARIEVTGSDAPSSQVGLVMNLVAVSGSSGSLNLLVNPYSPGSTIKLTLTGANIFDGDKWNICFGRANTYGDSTKSYRYTNKYPEYFLRCAKQSFGKIVEYHTISTASSAEPNVPWSLPGYYSANDNALTTQSTLLRRAPFIVIGSQSIPAHSSYFLNASSDPLARETLFNGNVAKVRFWSKKLDDEEWKEHVRNFKSLGVSNPSVNFNFTPTTTGSFEKLRIDADIDQVVTMSDASGRIEIFDFSQNEIDINGTGSFFHLYGYGFEPDKRVIKPAEFNYSFLSPTFDLSQTDEKVRVRSLLDLSSEYPYAQPAPIYEVPIGEYPEDDNRFSIEYSSVGALNEDIIRIFSSLDFFDNALGSTEVMFSDGYPDLENLRKVYFNRLEDKMNLTQFFQVFKWFDSSFSDLFYQILPRKTKFLGVNFVVESHVLERHKLMYMFDDIYLDDRTRTTVGSSTDIFTIDGTTTKF